MGVINYFVVNKKKLTKFVILLMVVLWCSSEFSHPIFSYLDSTEFCYIY